MSNISAVNDRASLYRTLWRWHFYASLFVIPFILILSVTGALYLFKPEIDRWEERGFHSIAPANIVSPNAQADAALGAFPGSRVHHYRLPEQPGDAALVHLELADGKTMRDVFVLPDGTIAGDRDPDATISRTLSRIHGSLLLGTIGDYMVELAACWAVVMILTGLYLWWPRGRSIFGGGLAGVLWPRVLSGRKAILRDLHAVTGFWVTGLALILLMTGLPWSKVWGDGFEWVRTEMGWVKGAKSWTTSGTAQQHTDHDHSMMQSGPTAQDVRISLAEIAVKAKAEKLAPPVRILPPGKGDWSVKGDSSLWTVQSFTQNRPQRVTIRYDAMTGAEVSREGFADKHVIDRVVNIGIAWHEGQLLGRFNQAIGVLTALALITLSISGFLMWRRRKPEGTLGAPLAPSVHIRMRGVAVIMILLALLLPLFALSLMLLWLIERVVLPRLPKVAGWLGMRTMSDQL